MSVLSATRSGGLPAPPPTPLIGRSGDAERLSAALDEHRLVTVWGPGGVGKTSLAAAVLRRLGATGTEVRWVDLGLVSDGTQVLGAAAGALDLTPADDAGLEQTLLAHLADTQMVLAIDNAEHVADEVARLVGVLQPRCPDVRMVVTSREPLRAPGEHVVPLDPLAPGDATRLFAERAGGAVGGCGDDEVMVAAVCARLDHLPLAIELAAARRRVLSVEQILEGLDQRFSLLTAGERAAPSRQRTLDASISWSVALLTEDERSLLSALGVFAGPFTITMAQSLIECVECMGQSRVVRAADDSPTRAAGDVTSGVLDLVEKSLVQTVGDGSTPRFRLLDSVRAYVRRVLAGQQDLREQVIAAYVDLMDGVIVEASAGLTGPGWRTWMTRLDEVSGDLQAAIVRAAEHTPWPRAAAMIGRLAEYWVRRPQIAAMTDLALELIDDRVLNTEAAAAAARGVALMCTFHHREDAGRELLDRVILQADGLAGTEPHVIACTAERVWAESFHGQPPGPVEARLRRRLDGIDDPWLGTVVHICLGVGHANQGSLAAALACFDEALAIEDADAPTLLTASLLSNAAEAHLLRGNLVRAERLMARARPLVCDVGDALYLQFLELLDGMLAGLRGDIDVATAAPGKAMDALRTLWHDPARMERAVYDEWSLMAARLRPDDDLRRRLRRRMDAGDAYASNRCRLLTAATLVALHLGHVEEAEALQAEASRLDRAESVRADRSATLLAAGHLRRAQGADDVMRVALRALDAHAEDERVFLPDVLELIAAIEVDRGNADRAVRLLAAAASARNRLGTVRWPIDRPRIAEVQARLQEVFSPDGSAERAEELAALRVRGAQLSLDEAVDLASAARTERPSTGWAALTPAEREVARLAASGLSNPDIAARLFVSRNTVKTHLSAVYSKLEVANRTELAALQS